MVGEYFFKNYESTALSGAMACRIEDKYAATYNFPTEFFTSNTLVNYTGRAYRTQQL